MNRTLNISACLLVWFCVFLSNSRGGWGKKGKCEVCKNFVKAFEEGLKSTENSNFAGGDTSWEEEKLGAYANSEVRFVEILDGVCSDHECHRLLEENEEHLERWWFKLKHEKTDLKMWFCHDQLDVCCPENTFGPMCEACPGGVDAPCGDQGVCEGAEEKDGSGTCRCNYGYQGDSCLQCANGFYNNSISCGACHRSCKDKCSGGGARDCEECALGYERSEEGAECKDVNECEEREGEEEEEGEGEREPICKEGKYCFNTPGSYRCNDCDKSCEKACTGAGPAKCLDCAAGYFKTQYDICRDINECEGGEGWEGDPVKCEGATFCENTPGSYQCKACHVACLGGCRGAGPTNCIQCKEGFNMEDRECKDINECDGVSPCDAETETCSNLIGSFKCKCKPGLVRVDGKCSEKITKEKDTKKAKRKKKAKKGGKTAGTDEVTAEQQEREREREEERERERKIAEAEGEKERRRRLGGSEGGTTSTVESHDQLEKLHDPSEAAQLHSVNESEKSHDHVEESPDQAKMSHDTSKGLHNIETIHTLEEDTQQGQLLESGDIQDQSDSHDEL